MRCRIEPQQINSAQLHATLTIIALNTCDLPNSQFNHTSITTLTHYPRSLPSRRLTPHGFSFYALTSHATISLLNFTTWSNQTPNSTLLDPHLYTTLYLLLCPNTTKCLIRPGTRYTLSCTLLLSTINLSYPSMVKGNSFLSQLVWL